MSELEKQVRAMRAEGFSVRQIARELGLSRMKVHRMLMAAPTPASVVDLDGASSVDPIASPLTSDDLARPGLGPADLALGLSALDRYRFLSLPEGSAAGETARELFDHGRGEGRGLWPPMIGQGGGALSARRR